MRRFRPGWSRGFSILAVGLLQAAVGMGRAEAQYGKGGYGFNPGYDQFGLYAFGFVNHEYGWAYYPGPGMTRPDHRPEAVRERAGSPSRKALARQVNAEGRLRLPWDLPSDVDRALDRRRLEFALQKLTDDGKAPTAVEVEEARVRLKEYGDGLMRRIGVKRPGFNTAPLRGWLEQLDQTLADQPTIQGRPRPRRVGRAS